MARTKMHQTATSRPKEGRTLDVVAQHRGITHRTALTDSGSLALRCDPARVVAEKEAGGGGYGPAPRLAPALPVDAGDVRAVRAVTSGPPCQEISTPSREVTDEERRAVESLEHLAARWPESLTLLAMEGTLVVVLSEDYAAGPVHRPDGAIVRTVRGIPCDGGGW